MLPRLTELEPRFIRYKGDKHEGHAKVDTLAEAQGIGFQCPTPVDSACRRDTLASRSFGRIE